MYTCIIAYIMESQRIYCNCRTGRRPVARGGPQRHVPLHQTSVPHRQDLCPSSTLCPAGLHGLGEFLMYVRFGCCSIMNVYIQRTFTYTQFYSKVMLHKK